jgi:hypothetical protein
VEFDWRIYSVKVFLREREVGLVHSGADANTDDYSSGKTQWQCITRALYSSEREKMHI